jgi:uncharacterized membrane protein YqjE
MSMVDEARRLAASLLALGRIRLELLSIEVQEEKRRLASLLFWAVLSALSLGFALLAAAAWITVALWDTHRLLALGFAFAGLAGLGGWGLLRLRTLTAARSTLFRASLGELRADEQALRRAAPAPAEPAAGP